MEEDTLMELSYGELMELYKAIREENRRRNDGVAIRINEKAYGTDQLE